MVAFYFFVKQLDRNIQRSSANNAVLSDVRHKAVHILSSSPTKIQIFKLDFLANALPLRDSRRLVFTRTG